jgi:hypothetical protein
MSGEYSGGSGQQSSSGNWAPPPPWAHWTGWSGWNQWANPHGRSPGGGAQSDLRIGDAERSEMIETLSKHFADGRLDENEMRERVEAATAARTRGDLSGLLNDLPPLSPQNGPGPVMIRRRRHRVLTFLLVAFIALSVAGWLAAPWHFPWVLFFILAFLVFRRGGWYHHHHHGGWNRSPNTF